MHSEVVQRAEIVTQSVGRHVSSPLFLFTLAPLPV